MTYHSYKLRVPEGMKASLSKYSISYLFRLEKWQQAIAKTVARLLLKGADSVRTAAHRSPVRPLKADKPLPSLNLRLSPFRPVLYRCRAKDKGHPISASLSASA